MPVLNNRGVSPWKVPNARDAKGAAKERCGVRLLHRLKTPNREDGKRPAARNIETTASGGIGEYVSWGMHFAETSLTEVRRAKPLSPVYNKSVRRCTNVWEKNENLIPSTPDRPIINTFGDEQIYDSQYEIQIFQAPDRISINLFGAEQVYENRTQL